MTPREEIEAEKMAISERLRVLLKARKLSRLSETDRLEIGGLIAELRRPITKKREQARALLNAVLKP